MAGQQRTHFKAQGDLLLAYLFESVSLGFGHGLAQAHQSVGGHGGVVGVAAPLIGFHDLQPLLEVHGEGAALCGIDGLAGAFAEHDHGAAGRAAPALLWCRDQDVDTGGFHVHPHGARGDAVEHEQATDGVHGIGNGLEVVIGQDHAGRGFDVGSEHQGGLFAGDGGHDLVDGGWHPGALRVVAQAARLHDGVAGRDLAHVEDLRPAVAEPAVADHQNMLAVCKLTCDRLHAEGATAGHERDRMCVVHPLEHGRDVGHHALEALGHVVERAVGVDHRKLEQTVRVDGGKQSRHGNQGQSQCTAFSVAHRPALTSQAHP